ncbi:Protein of unknown function DUF408 [Macleaya cordata]|uniref:RNA polymerase II subunit B1 CTD phosphatase RPAP2 homolog n=1 Tax=Macleaya cordata TaxID=56857 RepID=A0A200QRE6_MACCD|nr:Protein of unknown function DUF408 [Macleaya cordata]
MAKDQLISAKKAVHKLQLALLEGINNENQLFAAGSLISRSDYEDVVTERSISNICGYPLCNNPLPSERPRKGRYRISLKEHKVYDLQETYMYCSSDCVVNSRAFVGSLQDERCTVLNSAKIDEVLNLFGELGLAEEGVEKKGDLGLSELKIEEKLDAKVGEVSLDDWIGPSNAIEGYVPQRDRISSLASLKHQEEGSKPKNARPKKGKGKVVNEMDFTSTIIMGDQFSIPKTSFAHKQSFVTKSKGDQFNILEVSSAPVQNGSETILEESKGEVSNSVVEGRFKIPEMSSGASENGSDRSVKESNEEVCVGKTTQLTETALKSSLKSSDAKKLTRNVTWADEENDTASHGNLCDVQEMGDTRGSAESSCSSNVVDDESSLRFASAVACAIALKQAAECAACGESDVIDAVSEAGIVILPQQHHADGGDSQKYENVLELEPVPLKWPLKPGISDSELFDSEDSWYDTPPEGFSLTLSPFATMWMALFGWITSSSLAYIYGREESSQEEFLLVNGREYPCKIVLSDGRSSEIKQTLAGCLARALPGVVKDLRLPTPISTLEQGMGRLLDTMSFTDALPSFRMKQWHVIVLLFVDALSVCRIPGLTPHMTSTRMLLHKVLDGAQISGEEYEVMKDLLIPLGRLPQFSAQSGG